MSDAVKELTLSELKGIQLQILTSVHEYCDDNDIVYTLGFGTLLGAVRHQGFIPWDDDIDILMPRPDYQKFVSSFNDQPGPLRVRTTCVDSSYEHPFAKVENQDTKMVEAAEGAYDIGVNIDIFPLDGVPTDEREFEKFFKNLKLYRDAWVVKTIKSDLNERSFLKSLTLSSLKLLLTFFSRRKLVEIVNAKITRYNYDDSEFVMTSCFEGNKRKHKASKSLFEDIGELEFEGQRFKAITRFDDYLTMQYGDYMKLPPEEDRVTHHRYKAYG